MSDETKDVTMSDGAVVMMALDEFFAAMDGIATEITPTPWIFGVHTQPTVEELAEYAAESVRKRDGTSAFMAFVQDAGRDPDSYLTTAISGNGPRSAANAQFLIGCVNNYSVMRDAIRERDATITGLQAEIERLTVDLRAEQKTAAYVQDKADRREKDLRRLYEYLQDAGEATSCECGAILLDDDESFSGIDEHDEQVTLCPACYAIAEPVTKDAEETKP